MDISAFKGLLRGGRPSAAEFSRSLQSALAGISRHTLEGRDDELASFRESMLALASKIHPGASTMELETTVGQALELFRDYNERSLRFNESHAGELKTVMRTMTETITYLSESRTRSVHHLQFVERELEQAAEIDDVRLLRARIVSCLEAVREETVRLESEAQTRSQEVRKQMGPAVPVVQNAPSRFGIMDMVTGLPARRAAEQAISDALQSERSCAVAVFVVTKLSAINAKYGRQAGDEVMLRIANHFAQQLSADTQLYRWSGPALTAVSGTYQNAEAIRRAWTKAAAAKLEISIEAKGRLVFLLVETSLSFQLVTKSAVANELFQLLDKFVAEQGDKCAEAAG